MSEQTPAELIAECARKAAREFVEHIVGIDAPSDEHECCERVVLDAFAPIQQRLERAQWSYNRANDLLQNREKEIRETYAKMRPHFDENWREDFDYILFVLDTIRAQAVADREAAKCWRAFVGLFKMGTNTFINNELLSGEDEGKGKAEIVFTLLKEHPLDGLAVDRDTPEAAILAAAEAVLGKGWDEKGNV